MQDTESKVQTSVRTWLTMNRATSVRTSFEYPHKSFLPLLVTSRPAADIFNRRRWHARPQPVSHSLMV